MSNETFDRFMDELNDLLDRERKALIGGELEQLARIVTQKESLIAKINADESPDMTRLQSLQDKVSRNQELLDSAMEGIRAVADRMADLRRVRRNLETYDRDGRKTRFGTQTQSSVEKRA